MKVSFLALLVASVCLATFAKTPSNYQPIPDESKLVEHGSYVNKSGNTIHSPAHTKDGTLPVGATAKCRDATYSFSQHHQGTCSRHGGVAQWLN